jgi:ubiquinone/menaquinone biosynthesis C-methylase UbiE
MSNKLAAGFDRLAPVYDLLARIAIGREIRRSQLPFLNFLSKRHKLLILGWGTGWILPPLRKVNPLLRIDYVDISGGMIERARRTVNEDSRVQFIVGAVENIPDTGYDCVITNFYLDLFDERNLENVIEHIKNSLQADALWIVTDFVCETKWHEWMVAIMYRFFRWVTGILTVKLPGWSIN